MGNDGSKGKKPEAGKPAAPAATTAPVQAPKPTPAPPKKPELTEGDYQFLMAQTGSSREEIKGIFDKFMQNNADAKLDRKEFVRLYTSLRYEDPERLDEISNFVFRTFDADHNGFITFNEFMIAYALTSRGDLKRKLEYAFNLYDADANGFLDANEIKEVITGMLDLLGADKRHNDPKQLAQECLKELDSSKDGKVSKDEFVNGLLKTSHSVALCHHLVS